MQNDYVCIGSDIINCFLGAFSMEGNLAAVNDNLGTI